jgi:hypothetical protein
LLRNQEKKKQTKEVENKIVRRIKFKKRGEKERGEGRGGGKEQG